MLAFPSIFGHILVVSENYHLVMSLSAAVRLWSADAVFFMYSLKVDFYQLSVYTLIGTVGRKCT